jgi:hypothetical protein
MRSEYHISEEFQQQKAEGKRRQREYEGIDLAVLNEKGGCVGTHKMTGCGLPIADALKAASEDQEFKIWEHDDKGLESELRDLVRDAESFEKSEGVKFE